VFDYETNRFGFAPHSASSKRAPEMDSGAEPELIPKSGVAFEELVLYFKEGKPLPEPDPLPEPAADSAYYLISAIMISSLMSFALL